MSSAAVTGEVSSRFREVELSIRGMTCAACAARVEKNLNGMDDVVATVNFATEKATVLVPVSVSVERLIEQVEQAGYGAEVAGSAGGPDAARVSYLRRRTIVALVLFVPLSDLSVLLSLFPADRFPGWQWVLVGLAAPVVVWAAWPFHAAALKNARHGKRWQDVLEILGAGIDVITTLNIQHLESIADEVEHMAGADLDVVHVAGGDASRPGERRSLARLRELASDLGARWHELQDDDPAQAIARFARQHQITQIVSGSSQRSRWQQLTGGGSNVQRVIREAGAFGIDVHVIARRELPPAEAVEVKAAKRSP